MKFLKYISLIVAISLLLSSCKKTDELYSFYRVYFKYTYRTLEGQDLKTEANPDEVLIKNDTPSIRAYDADIVGKFTHVYDTIVQYGHVWSQTNPEPVINPNDTTTYTRLGSWPPDSAGTFISRISGLYPKTPFYVRSYIITSQGDTGYNPAVLVDTTIQVIDAWYKSKNMSTYGRDGAVAIKYGKGDGVRIVVGTGRSGQLLKNDFWEFDPFSEIWTQFANFPIQVTQAVGFSLNYTDVYQQKQMKLYAGTGELNVDGTSKSDYWFEFDFDIRSWKPTGSYATYPFKVSRAIAFAIDDKGYVGFGSTEANTSVTAFFRFDPVAADTSGGYPWVSMPTLADRYARADAIAFTIQGIGFVGTGINTNTNEIFRDLWKFYPDPISGGTWIKCANMPGLPRYGAVGFVIDDFGYVGLGTDGVDGYKDFYRYDPFINQWYSCADYKIGPDYHGEYQEVRDAVGFGVNSVGYVGTGYETRDTSTPYTYEFWKYIPW